MSPLDSLSQLEDKIHFLALRYTQLSEENQQLKDELLKERGKSLELNRELESIREEKEQFNVVKNNVRMKIEGLIRQLSSNDTGALESDVDEKPLHLTLEEAEALRKPFTDDLLSDTTINFLPEEDS